MKRTAKFNGKVDQIYWIWCAEQKNSKKYTARNSLNLNAEGYKCETGKATVFESPRMCSHMEDDYEIPHRDYKSEDSLHYCLDNRKTMRKQYEKNAVRR